MYWKFILADSRDLSNIALLTQARNRSLSLVHNKSGSLSFSHPIDAEYAEAIEKYATCVKAMRFNYRATLAARLAGFKAAVWDQIWSGPVDSIDEGISQNSMTINCVGWLERLAHRMIRRDKKYLYTPGTNPPTTATTTDDADIIFDLLKEVNGLAFAEAIGTVTAGATEFPAAMNTGYVYEGNAVNTLYQMRWPAGSSPNIPTWVKKGQKLPNEGPGGATPYVPAMRGKNYTRNQFVLPAIDELTAIENGCDIRLDPVTRELNIYRKKRTIRDDVIFAYGWGPRNIQEVSRQFGMDVVNYHLTTGSSGSIPKYQEDVASQLKYGLLEEVTSLSDVVDTVQTPTGPSQSVLWTNSAIEILLRSQPLALPAFTPFQWTPNSGVPEPFVDYDVGDQVRLTVKKGKRVNIQSLGVRVFGMTVNIDEFGNEKLSALQTSAGG